MEATQNTILDCRYGASSGRQMEKEEEILFIWHIHSYIPLIFSVLIFFNLSKKFDFPIGIDVGSHHSSFLPSALSHFSIFCIESTAAVVEVVAISCGWTDKGSEIERFFFSTFAKKKKYRS